MQPANGAADDRKNEALNASLASYLTLIFGGQSVVGRAASAASKPANNGLSARSGDIRRPVARWREAATGNA
jgi:hypothetical protein